MNIEALKENGTIAVFVIEATDKHSGQVTYWSQKGWVKEINAAKEYKTRKIAEAAMTKRFPINSYEQSTRVITVKEFVVI